MREVSDLFLLNVAQVAGGLLGLFVVGVLFFAETGFRRLDAQGGEAVEAYFRASTRIVFVLFVVPLSLSLTLVVLEPAWSAVLFALLSAVLVAANVDTVRRIRVVRRSASITLLANEVAGSAAVAVMVVLPWVLGGIDPTREDLTWAILLSLGAAVASVFALVLSVFDLASGRDLPQRPAQRDDAGSPRAPDTTS